MTNLQNRIPMAVLGATGMVGQQASDRSEENVQRVRSQIVRHTLV
jgi:aspartate-semialdehyde dehydrogenase